MCHVAAEMERQGFELPLMIGGATTSRVHTAVKIHPNYRRGQTVYVNDASRAVGVAQALMSVDARAGYVAELRGEYARIAAAHARAQEDKAAAAAGDGARQCAQARLVGRYQPPKPSFIGTKVLNDYPVEELVDYIDWTPFFSTWELSGKFPAILDDAKFGAGGALALRGCARHARQDRGRALVQGERRARLLAGQRGGRRYPCLWR